MASKPASVPYSKAVILFLREAIDKHTFSGLYGTNDDNDRWIDGAVDHIDEIFEEAQPCLDDPTRCLLTPFHHQHVLSISRGYLDRFGVDLLEDEKKPPKVMEGKSSTSTPDADKEQEWERVVKDLQDGTGWRKSGSRLYLRSMWLSLKETWPEIQDVQECSFTQYLWVVEAMIL